jgi:L-fucose isomerase-like protein
MDRVDKNKVELKKKRYLELTDFGNYSIIKLENIAKLGVVIDDIINVYNLHAIALRCWDEIEKMYGIVPCLILGELNERGISAACELDINNAVMMMALYLASDYPVMLLDVNNNYGKDKDKCILFHCGPVPISMMKGKGVIEEHLMFKKAYGEGSGVGVNVGEIMTGNVTLGSFKTEDGKLSAFVTEGELTDDKIEKEFFGCKTVFKKNDVEGMLKYMALNGYRHHVAITKGNHAQTVMEAFENYLDFQIVVL